MTTESANLRAPNKSFSAKLAREIKGNLKIMSETKEEKLEAAEVQSGENIELPKELTVCGIIGEWGAYQLSVTLFGIIYSAILSTSVVVGPMWTPDIRHICAPLATSGGGANATATSALLDSIDFASNPHQCQQVVSTVETSSGRPLMVECERFIYDDQQYGQVLTNSVSSRRDLPCNLGDPPGEMRICAHCLDCCRGFIAKQIVHHEHINFAAQSLPVSHRLDHLYLNWRIMSIN